MTTRERFHAIMSERRAWPQGSADWQYLTRTARKLVWIMRDVPPNEWRNKQ